MLYELHQAPGLWPAGIGELNVCTHHGSFSSGTGTSCWNDLDIMKTPVYSDYTGSFTSVLASRNSAPLCQVTTGGHTDPMMVVMTVYTEQYLKWLSPDDVTGSSVSERGGHTSFVKWYHLFWKPRS